MNWDEILGVLDPPECGEIREMLEVSTVVKGTTVGDVDNFYIESRYDETAYRLVEVLSEYILHLGLRVALYPGPKHTRNFY